jgi:hypothetical protein
VARGAASSISFGYVGGPSTADSYASLFGQAVGSVGTIDLGTDIALAGGASEILSGTSSSAISIPAVAVGTAIAAAGELNLGRVTATILQKSASGEGGAGGTGSPSGRARAAGQDVEVKPARVFGQNGTQND